MPAPDRQDLRHGVAQAFNSREPLESLCFTTQGTLSTWRVSDLGESKDTSVTAKQLQRYLAGAPSFLGSCAVCMNGHLRYGQSRPLDDPRSEIRVFRRQA